MKAAQTADLYFSVPSQLAGILVFPHCNTPQNSCE